jgi:translation elongation factor EF-Tu-like GTPase
MKLLAALLYRGATPLFGLCHSSKAMQVDKGPADIEAELSFLSTEEGGRATPCRSDIYRPTYDFGIEGSHSGAVCEFDGKKWAAPGETVGVRLWFLFPAFQAGRLYPGLEFTVHEGAKVVAKGRVSQVLNNALRKDWPDGPDLR